LWVFIYIVTYFMYRTNCVLAIIAIAFFNIRYSQYTFLWIILICGKYFDCIFLFFEYQYIEWHLLTLRTVKTTVQVIVFVEGWLNMWWLKPSTNTSRSAEQKKYIYIFLFKKKKINSNKYSRLEQDAFQLERDLIQTNGFDLHQFA